MAVLEVGHTQTEGVSRQSSRKEKKQRYTTTEWLVSSKPQRSAKKALIRITVIMGMVKLLLKCGEIYSSQDALMYQN